MANLMHVHVTGLRFLTTTIFVFCGWSVGDVERRWRWGVSAVLEFLGSTHDPMIPPLGFMVIRLTLELPDTRLSRTFSLPFLPVDEVQTYAQGGRRAYSHVRRWVSAGRAFRLCHTPLWRSQDLPTKHGKHTPRRAEPPVASFMVQANASEWGDLEGQLEIQGSRVLILITRAGPFFFLVLRKLTPLNPEIRRVEVHQSRSPTPTFVSFVQTITGRKPTVNTARPPAWATTQLMEWETAQAPTHLFCATSPSGRFRRMMTSIHLPSSYARLLTHTPLMCAPS